jgi:hypothetical protein
MADVDARATGVVPAVSATSMVVGALGSTFGRVVHAMPAPVTMAARAIIAGGPAMPPSTAGTVFA